MKITPSNQTLILAGERRGQGAASGNSPGKAVANSTPAGSVLQRVTIVAARPDTTVVYLRADYSPATTGASDSGVTYVPRNASRPALPGAGDAALGSESPTSANTSLPTTAGRSSGTSLVLRPVGATRDAYGNSVSSSSTTPGISSYLHPAEQYAQTQRILGITPRVPQIDVHA